MPELWDSLAAAMPQDERINMWGDGSQFAARDTPRWTVPATGMSLWPYEGRPALTEAELAQQAREAAAYQNRRKYAVAATRPEESNKLGMLVGGLFPGLIDMASRPGQTMAENPYPPGSEEAQYFEDQRKSNTYRTGPELAFNLMGTGAAFAPAGAAGMAGGKLGAIAEQAHAPPFYSAVERAVQDAKQNVAPGQQWAGFLRNQPGVKQEEVQALGLGKLFEQPSVSKELMLGEIAANRVNVGEVRKGGGYELGKEVGELTQQNEHLSRLYDETLARRGDTGGIADQMNANHDRIRELHELADQNQSTKFSQYTLPGGENYREMLLTLPNKAPDIPKPKILTELPQGPDWENSYRVIHYGGDPLERAYGVIPPGQAHARAMAGQHPTPEEATRQALNHINAVNAQNYNQAVHDAQKGFRSSHYDEPNILAHARYNDRVIDGKKTLFVEEVQSDWHQRGKREGYNVPPKIEIKPEQFEGKDVFRVYVNGEPRLSYSTRARAEAESPAFSTGSVPDAPFKTTWPELAMKRIIREAAEKGYDNVAWTPGSVQADRYDLSKQVDKISSYRLQKAGELELKDGQPQYRIEAFKDGKLAVDKYVTENELADHVGKELADKIVKQESGAHSYSGLDLKVGGEGMKGFYDEILPATVNKLVKKHGGRVTQGEIVKPEMKLSYEELQRRRSGEQLDPSQFKQTVHTLDITPSLRAAAMKGFPLFSAGGVAIGGAAARDDSLSDLLRNYGISGAAPIAPGFGFE